MKWASHRIIAFCATFFTFQEICYALLAIPFANFPDKIEGTNFQSKAWQKNHRQESHAIDIYLFILLTSLFSFKYLFNQCCVITINSKLTYLLLSVFLITLIIFSYASLLHIIADSFTGRIRLSLFSKKRLSFHKYVKGFYNNYIEKAFVTCLIITTFAYIIYKYDTRSNYTISPVISALIAKFNKV